MPTRLPTRTAVLLAVASYPDAWGAGPRFCEAQTFLTRKGHTFWSVNRALRRFIKAGLLTADRLTLTDAGRRALETAPSGACRVCGQPCRGHYCCGRHRNRARRADAGVPRRWIRERTAPGLKRCCCCEDELPADPHHFHRNARSPDGLDARCRPCRNDRRRELAEGAERVPPYGLRKARWGARHVGAAERRLDGGSRSCSRASDKLYRDGGEPEERTIA